MNKLSDKFSYLLNSNILALLLLDCILLPLALYTAIWLRLGASWDPRLNSCIWIFYCLPIWTVPLLLNLGLYRAIIKFVDDKIVYIVCYGVTVSVAILALVVHLTGNLAFPRSAFFIYWSFATLYIGGSRLLLRAFLRKIGYKNDAKSVAIYGAGVVGAQLATYLYHGNEYAPLFFIDDDSSKWYKTIRGLKVYPPDKLLKLKQKHLIDEVLLAIPSVPLSRRREIITNLENNTIYVKTLPKIDSLINGKVKFSDIEDVAIEDLLGRVSVAPDNNLMAKNIAQKSVMVTGAGGSIGSELCRQIANLYPEKLVLFESSEFALYTIEQEMRAIFPYLNIIPILGSVTNSKLVETILKNHSVKTIYHAAAYKHVPLVESCPLSGIENNSIGTYVVAKAAFALNIENMVLISTDKAVRPTNVMGASKRFAELIMQAFASQSKTTIFSMVRFGNVLGSSGSVVPLFKRQIQNGGPITVTHPEIIRYFMTIPEAVNLVIQAGNMACGGEGFVLDMGEPVKIVDLARKMIYLSGLTVKDIENPLGDIEIKFTGLRPGEKLYEELLIGDNPNVTEHERIMKANESYIAFNELELSIANMRTYIEGNNSNEALILLSTLVPESKLNIQYVL
ncbi:MAG: nucleoside-diphosphate sugar epimerase/dehydratase [Burkholderiales bacterium]|nr:nucleoside-diphosphate sugar epimerase/dehydratase [Burkholderiales bacterium]